MIFLSKVEDTFQISKLSCVVMRPHSSLDIKLRAHDSIQLRTPDGRVIDTYVAAIPIVCGPEVRKDVVVFQLPKSVTQQDVPRGTEIWLVGER